MVQATQADPRVLPFPATSTDEHLIARASDGDTAAFTTLVERYRRPVYALAYRMLRHPVDAEDAAQETFVRAYVRLSTFRPGSNFRAWLLSITSHWCIDQLRRHQLVSLDTCPPLDASDDDPEACAIRAERQREIRQQIAILPEHYRQVLELRYWQDLSYAEVGDAIAVPPLHRAHAPLSRPPPDAPQSGGRHQRCIWGAGDGRTAKIPGANGRTGDIAHEGHRHTSEAPPLLSADGEGAGGEVIPLTR